jgi:FkbM family methyltransferase
LIEVELTSHRGRSIPLGERCEFTLRSAQAGLRAQLLLRVNGILYLTPIRDWALVRDGEVFRLFPESPGPYALLTYWRTEEGQGGVLERQFEVRASVEVDHGPRRVELKDKVSLWAPTAWEARLLPAHERSVLDACGALVKPGTVVYDIGANLGLFGVHFGRLAGAAGRVYCFEANPVCVYFLRAHLELNGVSNCEILPVAVSNEERGVDFSINYDNSNLGLAQDSGFFTSKLGHHVQVGARSLDELVPGLRLRPPDVIKIDIEGAEAVAIAGMRETLRASHPRLVMELHGRAAALATLKQLDALGYAYTEVASGRRHASASAVVAAMPEAPVHVVANA